jgi:hypothetical protein
MLLYRIGGGFANRVAARGAPLFESLIDRRPHARDGLI